MRSSTSVPRARQRRPQASCAAVRPPSLAASSGSIAAAATPTQQHQPARSSLDGRDRRRTAIVAQAAAGTPPLLLAAPSLHSLRDRLVRDELPRLFSSSSTPLSPDLYSESLVFADPLASFAGLPLYELNLSAIRALFDVEFTTHAAVVREQESSVVTRWTMTMAPKGLPDRLPFLTGAVRRPRFSVTGTSVYGVDQSTGRIVSHVDTWDSLPMRRQDAFKRARAPVGASALGGDGADALLVGSGSEDEDEDDDHDNGLLQSPRALLLPPRPRGLLHVARRALRAALAITPDLSTPSYDVLLAAPCYELRRYAAFALAETDMSQGATPSGGSGFGQLVGFIGGGNSEGRKWEMTTPVLTESGGGGDERGEERAAGGERGGSKSGAPPKMAFVLDENVPPADGESGDTAPFASPRDPSVRTRVEDGGRLWASVPVQGWPLDGDVRRAERRLRGALARDGVARAVTAPGSYRLLRYNDPLTPPQLRRNELLVEVEFLRARGRTQGGKGGGGGGGGGGGNGDNNAWAEALLMVRE